MPIEQLINYHKEAGAHLELELARYERNTILPEREVRIRAFKAAIDFHNRAIVVLTAAEEMFKNHEGLVEKAAAYDALQKNQDVA